MSTKRYQKPDFYVEEFAANEYISACDGSITATATCVNGGTVSLTNGYDNGNGLYTFPGGYQLYTNTNLGDAVLVGTIYEGHDPSSDPRIDGEYTQDGMGGTKACGHILYGADGHTPQNNRHHHLRMATVHNRS